MTFNTKLITQSASALRPRTGSIARLIATGAFLGLLTSTTVFAGSIAGFTAANPAGCSTLPAPSTGGTSFAVSLGLPVCAITYTFNSGASTSYPLTFAITNNTGQAMTDLHFALNSLATAAPFFSGPTVNSGPLVLVGLTATTLDFALGSILPVGSVESISVNLTLPSGFQSGQDNIIITPTFGTPEPASFMLVGSVLVGLGLIRRRKSA